MPYHLSAIWGRLTHGWRWLWVGIPSADVFKLINGRVDGVTGGPLVAPLVAPAQISRQAELAGCSTTRIPCGGGRGQVKAERQGRASRPRVKAALKAGWGVKKE